MAREASDTSQGEVTLEPVRVETELGEVSEDKEAQTLKLRLHSEILLAGRIDQEALEKTLLGKNTKDIEEALAGFPSIKKINLEFKPSWFGTGIPKSESRVEVVIDPPSEE